MKTIYTLIAVLMLGVGVVGQTRIDIGISPSPATEAKFDGRCPVCVREGQRSTVVEGMVTSTAMGSLTFYDENGKRQYYDPNVTTAQYECSSRHRFSVSYGQGKSWIAESGVGASAKMSVALETPEDPARDPAADFPYIHCVVSRVTPATVFFKSCSHRFLPDIHARSHTQQWSKGGQFHLLEGQTGCTKLPSMRYRCERPEGTGEAVVKVDHVAQVKRAHAQTQKAIVASTEIKVPEKENAMLRDIQAQIDKLRDTYKLSEYERELKALAEIFESGRKTLDAKYKVEEFKKEAAPLADQGQTVIKFAMINVKLTEEQKSTMELVKDEKSGDWAWKPKAKAPQ